MRKIFLFLLLTIFSTTSLLAQEESDEIQPTETKTSNQYFDITLTRGTQSPINKAIPYTVEITPKINSPRTQILWDIPTVFTLNTKYNDFESLSSGQTYKFKASIKPDRSGLYNITVNVISWQHDTNKMNSVKDTIAISNGLTVYPTDTKYVVYLILFIIAIILGIIGFIFLIVKIVQKFLGRIRKWLTPPF